MRHIPVPHPWRKAPASVTRDARTSKSAVLPICDALGLNRSSRRDSVRYHPRWSNFSRNSYI